MLFLQTIWKRRQYLFILKQNISVWISRIAFTWEETSRTPSCKSRTGCYSNYRMSGLQLSNASRTIICSLELPRISWIEKKIIPFSGIPEHFSEILACSFFNVILENFQDFFEKFSTLVRFSVDLHPSNTAGH